MWFNKNIKITATKHFNQLERKPYYKREPLIKSKNIGKKLIVEIKTICYIMSKKEEILNLWQIVMVQGLVWISDATWVF